MHQRSIFSFLPAVLAGLLIGAGGDVTAQLVEPDDFDVGTDLTAVSAFVSLHTEAPSSGLAGLGIVPSFEITAQPGDFGTADASPTGDLVFAHTGVPFFNTNRILRGDFAGSTTQVSLAFSPSSTLASQVGRLEAYDFAGGLLTAVETAPLLAVSGELVTETLSITRPETNDIAFFRAYTSVGSFGRFDALGFGDITPVDILTGDFSGDGFVSQADLDLILLNWGDTALPAGFDPVALAQPGPARSGVSMASSAKTNSTQCC